MASFPESCRALGKAKIDLKRVDKERRMQGPALTKARKRLAEIMDEADVPSTSIKELWKKGHKARMFAMLYAPHIFWSASADGKSTMKDHPALQAYAAFYMRMLMRLCAEQHPMGLKTYLLAKELQPFFDGEKNSKWAIKTSCGAAYCGNPETHVGSKRARPEVYSLGLWKDLGEGVSRSRISGAPAGVSFLPQFISYMGSQVRSLGLQDEAVVEEVERMVTKELWKTSLQDFGGLFKNPPEDAFEWITEGYEPHQMRWLPDV